jgi:hypothetical protein
MTKKISPALCALLLSGVFAQAQKTFDQGISLSGYYIEKMGSISYQVYKDAATTEKYYQTNNLTLAVPLGQLVGKKDVGGTDITDTDFLLRMVAMTLATDTILARSAAPNDSDPIPGLKFKTSDGTLTLMTLGIDGVVTASGFVGDGSGLLAIPAVELRGLLPDSAIPIFEGDVSSDGKSPWITVDSVGGKTYLEIAASVDDTQNATDENTASTLVKRDASGNFVAGDITAHLFKGDLEGYADFAYELAAELGVGGGGTGAISLGTSRQPVLGNGVGPLTTAPAPHEDDENAEVIFSSSAATKKPLVIQGGESQTANLQEWQDSAATVKASVSNTGKFTGDGSGLTLVAAATAANVGGQTAANVAAGALLANNATDAGTFSTLVKRDASGNFAAAIITATLNGNAATANEAVDFTGTLVGDVSGTQTDTVVDYVGGATAGVTASEIIASVADTGDATSLADPGTLVKRDNLVGFEAGYITVTNLTVIEDISVQGDLMVYGWIYGDGSGLANLDAGTIASGKLPLERGGTDADNAADALNNLLPSQAGKTGLVLKSDGHSTSPTVSWGAANLPWTVKTDDTTALQAVANNGYVAAGSAKLTITLPASPAVGDVLRVVGKNGGSGWRIAQAADQQILGVNGSFNTTAGTGGYVEGGTTGSSIELVYIGSSQFVVVNQSGTVSVDVP